MAALPVDGLRLEIVFKGDQVMRDHAGQVMLVDVTEEHLGL
ncbi:hypothetical protein [Streptomyces sp. NPDC050759]